MFWSFDFSRFAFRVFLVFVVLRRSSRKAATKNVDDTVHTILEKFILAIDAREETADILVRETSTRKREREARSNIGSADSARARDGTDGGNDVTGVVIHMASGVDPRSCCARDRELLSIVSGRRHLGQ